MHPTRDIFNGMVSRQKRALASSEGALLIDELIEWLDEQIDADPAASRSAPRAPLPGTHRRARSRSGTSCPTRSRPASTSTTDKLLERRREPRLGRRARAERATATGRGAPRADAAPAEDPDYRFAVVQSELYRRYLRLAVRALRRPPARALPQAPLALVPGARARRARRARRADAARPLRARPDSGLAEPDGGDSTLLVDNYDSYTYNVFHLLAAVTGEEPIVVHNDMVSWRALSRWDFDAIVLSPGPGRPERWHDFGVCADILRCSEIPGARHLPRPPGPRTRAQRDGRERADARCTDASARSSTSAAACSRASPRTSRSCATTRSRSPARSGPRAA